MISSDEAVTGLFSAPRTTMPYSVSIPQTFGIAMAAPYPHRRGLSGPSRSSRVQPSFALRRVTRVANVGSMTTARQDSSTGPGSRQSASVERVAARRRPRGSTSCAGWSLDADAVHDELRATVAWEQGRVFRYERWIDEPRLGAVPVGAGRHPALADVERWIAQRYKVQFGGVASPTTATGATASAFHRDRELRWLDDTVIGVLTLGARRPWLMKPLTGRRTDADDDDHLADAIDLSPASGDLLVMGGRCQAAWLHAVPKVQAPRRAAGSPPSGAGRRSVAAATRTRRTTPPRHFSR